MVNGESIAGALRLPRIFSDGMVLQRDAKIRVWGWAKPRVPIHIRLAGHAVQTDAGENGRWEVWLPPLPAGGPHTLTVQQADTCINVQEVLVGEVWICTGQSNMELPMERVWERYEEDIRLSYNLGIRFFTVPCRFSYEGPEEDLEGGQWNAANPESVLGFSATAYFFARSLFERYHLPVGIVCAAKGGSRVESWMSRDALRAYPEEINTILRWSDREFRESTLAREQAAMNAWYEQLHREDEGLRARPVWYSPSVDTSAWVETQVPGYWEEAGMGTEHGAVWFRRDIEIAPELAGKPAWLTLGRIVDADTAYVNGIRVGETGYQYPPRRYAVPGGVLQEGRNTLAVRIVSTAGRGGFSYGKPYALRFADGTVIDLTGSWQCKRGVRMPPAPAVTHTFKLPSVLYNAMLAPIQGYTARGFTWYQGESNADAADAYQERFAKMVDEWRQGWGQGELPFLYVQLPCFTAEGGAPADTWARMREVQRRSMTVPGTAMVVTVDVGEWNDLHPTNKKPVGERLALLARRHAYGEDIVCSGPALSSAHREGDRVRLRFAAGCGGLATRDGEVPCGFELAGADGRFHPAQAQLTEGDSVLVHAAAVSVPHNVRYAWAEDPSDANLCGVGGLPASPFEQAVEED